MALATGALTAELAPARLAALVKVEWKEVPLHVDSPASVVDKSAASVVDTLVVAAACEAAAAVVAVDIIGNTQKFVGPHPVARLPKKHRNGDYDDVKHERELRAF